MQFVISAFLSRGRGVGDALSPLLPPHLIALLVHFAKELLPRPGALHDVLDCDDQLELPAVSSVSRPVFPSPQALGAPVLLVWLQGGEAVLHADLVADLPHLLQGVGDEVQLFPGVRVDGVDDQVGVQVLRINVCGHQHLTAWEEPLCQFLSDLVRFRRRDFLFGREGLDVLVEEGSAGLPVKVLGCQEAFLRQLRRAVDTGEIAAAGFIHRLFFLGHIADHTPHGARRLLPFFDVATGRQRRSPVLSL